MSNGHDCSLHWCCVCMLKTVVQFCCSTRYYFNSCCKLAPYHQSTSLCCWHCSCPLTSQVLTLSLKQWQSWRYFGWAFSNAAATIAATINTSSYTLSSMSSRHSFLIVSRLRLADTCHQYPRSRFPLYLHFQASCLGRTFFEKYEFGFYYFTHQWNV